jgi:hypothetical protein
MMRNLKVLGLALVAVFAMSAVAASMASADDLTSESSPVILSGKQEGSDVLTITAGNIACKEIKYSGTTITPTTTVTVTPSYPEKTSAGEQNCTALGFPSIIHTNGCTYLFHINGAGSTTGTVDIVCPAGKEITVTTNAPATIKCTLHFPAQTGLGPVTYINTGAGTTRELRIETKITNLKYSHTAGTGLGTCTTGTGTTGGYVGKMLFTGLNDSGGSGHVGIFLS